MSRHRSAGGHGWFVGGLAREAAERFRAAWSALPGRARKRWLVAFATGFLLSAALSVALTLGARRVLQDGTFAWEVEVLRWFRDSSPVSFSTAMWLAIPGNSVVLWPLMVFASGVAAWRYRPLHALSLLGGYVLEDVIVLTGWALWQRDRPTLIQEGAGAPGGIFNAFPSGHLSQTLFAYGLLAYFWMRASRSSGERLLAGLVVLVLVAASAVGRLRVGAHYPTDLVAGLVVGGAWLAAVIVALRLAEERGAPRRDRPISMRKP